MAWTIDYYSEDVRLEIDIARRRQREVCKS
jgi:hypothetical protein